MSNRETTIKDSLIKELSENAREIQYEFKEHGKDYLELADCTTSLSSTLEAIFLHGLKDSFLWQTINVISGDIDRRPEPSFWVPLLVFLHKQVIEQIQSLSQINSEIGYCRSWIRVSLNESLLSSYLNNIRKNASALNPYYKRHAFLKDTDNLEVASKILEGIESCVHINLPINSALLNRWSDYALQLAGLWVPPLRSCPIASGIDIAGSITDQITIPTPQPLQTNEIFSDSISNSPFNQTKIMCSSDLTDKENLQVFLQKIDEIQDLPTDTQPTSADECPLKVEEPGYGTSILLKRSWSNPAEHDSPPALSEEHKELPYSRSNSMTTSISSLKSPVDHHSYNTLLVKHQKTRELDWHDVWERFESSLGITGDSGITINEENCSQRGSASDCSGAVSDENAENLGFEFVPQSLSEKFTITELQEMVEQVCQLAREPGLDSQGFVCKLCAHPLGIGFAPAQVCSFNGHYYCENCMSVEQFMIPAKIIYNWNFRKYSVSKKAAAFITEFQLHPFIDLKLLNPDIYTAVEEMASLQSLRIQLNFIRAYLFTCCTPIIKELQKQVWSREYLYEHIHRYSIADLMMIQKNVLSQLLQRTVSFGEHHIMNCSLCSVKGFICEVCTSPKVLYPFHIDTTFRCQTCGAVFHASCLNDLQPCPKCERKRKREDFPLYEAVHML